MFDFSLLTSSSSFYGAQPNLRPPLHRSLKTEAQNTQPGHAQVRFTQVVSFDVLGRKRCERTSRGRERVFVSVVIRLRPAHRSGPSYVPRRHNRSSLVTKRTKRQVDTGHQAGTESSASSQRLKSWFRKKKKKKDFTYFEFGNLLKVSFSCF